MVNLIIFILAGKEIGSLVKGDMLSLIKIPDQRVKRGEITKLVMYYNTLRINVICI